MYFPHPPHGTQKRPRGPKRPSTTYSVHHGIRERMLLDEMLRLGFSRGEDLGALMGKSTTSRTVLEIGFREEWRTGREEEILQILRDGSFFRNQTPSGESHRSLRKHLR